MIRPRELGLSVTAFAARTPTLPPATHTNSYAIGAREVVLVEPATPYEDEQKEWIAWARALGSTGRTPVAILATHHHLDHIGGLDVFSRELGLPVWTHAETASRIGTPVARRLEDGDDIVLGDEAWRVMHTPGHAAGHVCLFEPRTGTLVVGDMVASVGTILVAPGDGDMAVYIAQLRRLADVKARLALPAHGDPIDEPTALFERYVAHRLMREAKVLAAIAGAGDKGGSIAELVLVAYDDTPAHVYPIAALSLEAHADKLVNEGRARRAGERYVIGSEA